MKNRIIPIVFVVILCLCSDFVSAQPVRRGMSRNRARATLNPKTEVNAAWIATVSNLNWPSRPGLTVEQQKKEAVDILDRAKELGLNLIVFQVRPAGDAFYRSEFFPWSKCLTGTQGKDPGYDPLEFWIEQSHDRGIGLHAWINPYRLATSGGGEKANFDLFCDDHPARKHPDWVVPYADGKIYFNPGIPACRKFVVEAALEIVRNYRVDGIHIDDYFYPYPSKDDSGKTAEFDDAAAFREFGPAFLQKAGLKGAAPKDQLDHWRRNNVNLLVRDIHNGIRRIDRQVRFGISPFGIWRNRSTDPTGSNTKGLQSYDAIYADTKFWVENGLVDYIVPQLYWNIGYDVADYAVLLDWWNGLAESNRGVDLFIGLAAHRVGGKEGTPWSGSEEIVRQVRLNRSRPGVKGQCYFGWPAIAKNKAGVADNIRLLIKEQAVENRSVGRAKTGSPKEKSLPKNAPRFRPGRISVYLNPSLQPKNIGFGEYGTEEDRMHELAVYVENRLKKHGITVYQNRIGMTLRESIDDSNAKKPTIHVALHSNAFKKETRGVETFYRESGEQVEQCKELATALYDGLLKIYDGPRRGVKPTSTLLEPRTVTAPNTLIEVAFHDNEVDSKWILENMELIGENVAESIVSYLAKNHPEALVNAR